MERITFLGAGAGGAPGPHTAGERLNTMSSKWGEIQGAGREAAPVTWPNIQKGLVKSGPSETQERSKLRKKILVSSQKVHTFLWVWGTLVSGAS